MSVFVTVGSTSFDNLIETVNSLEIINLLASNGFKKIVFQIGKGNFLPPENSVLDIEYYRFKENISYDIKNASLIIGHAGAGTILESLFEYKPLIVVLNEDLMNNHQGELAEKLADENLLKYTTCPHLLETIQIILSEGYEKIAFKPQQDIFIDELHYILGLK